MATAKWDGKRWRLRVSIDGKVRSYSSTTPGRKGKAEVEEKAYKQRRLTEVVKFSLAWERYLEEVRHLTGPEHYKNTESIGRNYLLPLLGDKKLTTLRLNDYQQVMWSVTKKDGSPLSKKSLSNIRGTLVNFSKFCERSGLMEKSLNELRLPKDAPKIGKEILQPDDARRLMTEFEDEWYIYMWRWLLCTGTRPGEALGLKWSDLHDGQVTITRAVNYRGRITEGKNENARRTFFLNEILNKILADQKDRTWRLNSEYIFCNHAGKHSLQTVTSNSWYRIARQMGSKTSPYCLRHTFISYMAQALPEHLLKALVGHSIKMDTYGVYGHAVNGEGQYAADQVNITLVEKMK